MRSYLDSWHREQWSGEDAGAADLGSERIVDAFLGPACLNIWAVRISERQAYSDPRLGALRECSQESGVLDQEQAAVDEYVDVLAGHRMAATEAEVTDKVRELERKRDAGKADKVGRAPTVTAWMGTYLDTVCRVSSPRKRWLRGRSTTTAPKPGCGSFPTLASPG